jgi:hypothetical protein
MIRPLVASTCCIALLTMPATAQNPVPTIPPQVFQMKKTVIITAVVARAWPARLRSCVPHASTATTTSSPSAPALTKTEETHDYGHV